MKTVTIKNEFHGTEARVRVGSMTAANANRVAAKLCGVSGCTCGQGSLSVRGPQRTEDGQRILIDEVSFDGACEVTIEA